MYSQTCAKHNAAIIITDITAPDTNQYAMILNAISITQSSLPAQSYQWW
jgi:hypothetical protein